MNAVTRMEDLPERLPQLPAVVTPYDMVTQAVTNGASVEVVGRLLDLHERWEASRARKAFDAAIADAKAKIPTVAKNREGHNKTRYADFAAYAAVVDPIISSFGLSYRFRTKQTDRITVTCILSHREGHSEENELSGPSDKTGNKNDIQAIGSTLSYLQRYTLVQALGLAASNDDDGKRSGQTADEAQTLTDDQVSELLELMAETKSDMKVFLQYNKVDRIEDIAAGRFAGLMAKLNTKKAEQAKANANG